MLKEDFTERIKKISELTGDNETVMNELKELQTNLLTENFNEVIENGKDENGILWSEKYDDLQRKYRDRFFSTGEDAKDEQNDDINKDTKNTETINFDDLFKSREGNYKGE